jgi:response regulator RpfG family c-di-GMP phosphodiesterase
MMFAAPRLILSVDFPDANNLLAGMLRLKGFKVFKSKSTSDCMSIFNQIKEKVDVFLTDTESVIKNNFFLVNQIKKMTPDTMVVIMADNVDDEEEMRKKNIDEFVFRPISPDNLADRILNMLAKRELKRLKKSDSYPSEYQVNF